MVNIHGKEYVTVAERLLELNKKFPQQYSLQAEVLQAEVLQAKPVLVKATLTIHTEKGDRVFVGHSAANPMKSIEKQSPYEVAESSAWGRALAAAGFATEGGIATADEMNKGGYETKAPVANMITLPQIKKIAAMLPQTRYGDIGTFETETGVKVKALNKQKASELIAKLEDASMTKVFEDSTKEPF